MNISKLLFVNWSPDDTPLKARMIYATAKEGFREYLDAQGKEVTLNSKKDVQFALIQVIGARTHQTIKQMIILMINSALIWQKSFQ